MSLKVEGVNCLQTVPMNGMKVHEQVCIGGSSSATGRLSPSGGVSVALDQGCK